ncbi:Inner membrane protein [Saliniradius amylolyticus]|uniref:Inner membrane protein n=1 Tax=Saliniradius amylolyticus TaxID=2183582 RepID=A0A2S2E0Y7_9ALTE|nr:YbaN family protein [Saliniradius amylolyticus]AWL11315.1 Inner membrane protein [Saliniradius amylolyticus]
MVAIYWRILASLSLITGFIGVLLPGLPTVPFILVAAWASSKGWPRLENYLLGHPKFGDDIRQWRGGGYVRRRAKYMATLLIGLSMLLLWMSQANSWLAIIVTLICTFVLLWLWLRPEPQH